MLIVLGFGEFEAGKIQFELFSGMIFERHKFTHDFTETFFNEPLERSYLRLHQIRHSNERRLETAKIFFRAGSRTDLVLRAKLHPHQWHNFFTHGFECSKKEFLASE